ncbi:MAG: fluoride efflux transporter CrcB [Bryobacteraceae bacterium]
MIRYILVLAGGAVGCLTRFVVGTAIIARLGGRFPYGTVFINITGSFLIGFAMTFLTERSYLSPNWRFLLVVGFLGGYTTFSSFQWETLNLMKDGSRWLGFLNGFGSLVVGYAAVWLGAIVAGRK